MILRLIVMMCAAFVLTGCAQAGSTEVDGVMQAAPVIYLVRHAEKQTGSDPALTEAGAARAERLAAQLQDAGLQAVYATETMRAQETARPAADDHGLEITSYDARDLAGFAHALKQAGQTALVVGHSNTTPQLAGLLGGESGPEMDESDYERLYAVSLAGGETRMFVAGGDEYP